MPSSNYYDAEDEDEDEESRPRRSRPSRFRRSDLREASSTKIAAGLCGILVGALGVHKFILGYTTAGLIMLLATVLTCGVAGIIMSVIGLAEGIIYLTRNDEEFYEIYVAGRKEWF